MSTIYQDYFAAVIKGNVSAVVGFLRNDPRLLEMRDSLGKSGLYLSIQYGHESLLNIFLDADANVNSVGPGGYTPLAAACKEGQHSVIKKLLDSGANPLVRTMTNQSPADILRAYEQKVPVRFWHADAIAAEMQQCAISHGRIRAAEDQFLSNETNPFYRGITVENQSLPPLHLKPRKRNPAPG